jgi:hypothetical protein
MRSEAIDLFVQNHIQPDPDSNISSQETLEAFVEWSFAQGWTPPSEKIIQLRLQEAILRFHGKPKSNNLQRSGKAVRGWHGLKLLDLGSRAFLNS